MEDAHAVRQVATPLLQPCYKIDASGNIRSTCMVHREFSFHVCQDSHISQDGMSLRVSPEKASGYNAHTFCGENNLAALNAARVPLKSPWKRPVK